MAGLKEIKRRIKSVQNTSKITYAMKLVSAAKLKKVQDAVTESRTYTAELKALLSRLLAAVASGTYSSPLIEARESVKNIALVVIGGQRGLCGGYNTNLNKRFEAELKALAIEHPEAKVSFYIIGKKPAEYLRKTERSCLKSFEELSENTSTWPLDEICFELEQDFVNGKFDEVRICFTRFKSAMTVTPVCERLFPLAVDMSTAATGDDAKPTKFEPDVSSVISAVLPRVARTQLRQACLDAKASETGSRMTAMDAATRNAKELGKKLQRKYNRVRQQGITSQLLDIIGGAEAV
jgi:F-type H+-transporting ATPase subunit gamma